jgi:hypothetical protein
MQIVPRRRSKLALVVSSLLASLTMLAAVPLMADDSSTAARVAGVAAMGAAFLFMAVIGIAFYVYFALALQTIAKKTNTPNDWWAWVPIISAILMLNIAKKPVWWFILFLVPLVNIVIIIITFMAIAEARNKPNWWGILMILPLVNLIAIGYLAWAD